MEPWTTHGRPKDDAAITDDDQLGAWAEALAFAARAVGLTEE